MARWVSRLLAGLGWGGEETLHFSISRVWSVNFVYIWHWINKINNLCNQSCELFAFCSLLFSCYLLWSAKMKRTNIRKIKLIVSMIYNYNWLWPIVNEWIILHIVLPCSLLLGESSLFANFYHFPSHWTFYPSSLLFRESLWNSILCF